MQAAMVVTARIGLALWLPLLLAACGAPDEAEFVARARRDLEAGEPAQAAVGLRLLLKQHADSSDGHLLYGHALLATGDTQGAEAEFRRARQLGQSDGQVLPPLASAMLANGRAAAVVAEFDAIRLIDVLAQADLRNRLAQAKAMTGDAAGAQAANDEALRLAPADPQIRLLRARLLAARGETGAALNLVDSIATTNPEDPQLWLLRGELLRHEGRSAVEVAQAYQRALELQGNLAQAHLALLAQSMARRELTAAAQQLAAFKAALPEHPQTRYYEALLALARGDAVLASKLSQTLLAAEPANAGYLALAGEAERLQGAAPRAESLLRSAVDAAPSARWPRLLLADLQMRVGQGGQALDTLAPLSDRTPPDERALTLAGQILLQRGDLKKALALVERAGVPAAKLSEVRPQPASFKLNGPQAALHDELEALGPAQDAKDAYVQAVLRARTATERGNKADARQFLEQAVRRGPAVPGLR